MADIILVRQQDMRLSEDELAVARRVMFGMVDGLGERGQKQWRRLWRNLLRLEPGEMVSIKTHQARVGWFHRKHMALETAVFEAQERFESFEGFRDWLKVGAGFCDWYPGPRGGVFPVPKSIAFDKLEQAEMEQVHGNMVEFLRSDHAGKTLWKHLSAPARIEMVEGILGGFQE